jgi:DNA replication protein DnaC
MVLVLPEGKISPGLYFKFEGEGNAAGTAEYRIRRIMKSELIIIDEIGYTPIEKREANLFFNMISELYEKVSLIITSNKSFESWAEMTGDSVMTTALLDRLLHHAKIFTLDGESYRIKKSGKEV